MIHPAGRGGQGSGALGTGKSESRPARDLRLKTDPPPKNVWVNAHILRGYEGDDPDGYALAVNVARRNLRPSQKYMITEMARRVTGVRKSAISDSHNTESQLASAATVLDHAPDLARRVAAGQRALAGKAVAGCDRFLSRCRG
jgi:hypothetical protein